MKYNNIKIALITLSIFAFVFSFVLVDAQTVVKTKATSSRMLLKEHKEIAKKEITQDAKTKIAKDIKSRNASSTSSVATSTKKVKGLDDAIEKSVKEVDKRIENLNKLIEKITDAKNISDSDRNSLKSSVEMEITRLNALKSKILSSTDLKTVQSDTKTVISGSRINALIIPKITILASVSKINTVATMLDTVALKLQTRIDTLKAEGKDVVKLEGLMSDVKTNISKAKEEALTAETTVKNLTPDSGDKNKLSDNNTNLKLSRESVKKAHQYLAKTRSLEGQITAMLNPEYKERATTTKATSSKSNVKPAVKAVKPIKKN